MYEMTLKGENAREVADKLDLLVNRIRGELAAGRYVTVSLTTEDKPRVKAEGVRILAIRD